MLEKTGLVDMDTEGRRRSGKLRQSVPGPKQCSAGSEHSPNSIMTSICQLLNVHVILQN